MSSSPPWLRWRSTHWSSEEVERLVQAGLAEPGRITVSSEPDVRLTTDADMLRQVIANLLRNAVLYGGVAPVGARIYRQGRDLLLEVTNEGGLSAKTRRRGSSRASTGAAPPGRQRVSASAWRSCARSAASWAARSNWSKVGR